jgi:hypothetical protein
VHLLSSGNLVGGPANAAQNIISGNAGNGMSVQHAGATDNTISNNHIGTDADSAEDLGNSLNGMFVEDAPGVIVGGNGAGGAGAGANGEGNIISGNNEHGVEIIGDGASGTKVLDNFIGVNLNGNGFSNIGNSLDGVFVSTTPQVEIGGALTGQSNTISDNGRHGVQIANSSSTNNKVLGNRIGTNRNGSSDFGNAQDGVLVRGSGNFVGGTEASARNVISGNNLHDVQITQSPTGNEILGNFIGTNLSGTAALGNSINGVVIGGPGNTVGGTDPGAGNLISGNNRDGVQIASPTATNNQVQGNFIGTDVNGTSDLGNSGFGVFINAPDNFIRATASGEGNTIAFSGQDGVVIAGSTATGNRILHNLSFSNGDLGIDLIGGTENAEGATANDARDPDKGPNNLQNRPVIEAATTSGGSTTIEVRLNSTPNRNFTIEFFSNPACNEGKTFLRERSVTTNADDLTGTVTVTVEDPVTVGETITATATGPGGNTSEFSNARVVE